MSSTTHDQTERLVRFSRRQLWCVLVFLLGLGASHLLDFFTTVHVPGTLTVLLIVALCVWNPLKPKDIDFSSKSPAMKAIRNDELRQAAQAKAFRNGFFVLLAYPPLCAFALIGLGVREPLAVVVASSAWLGAIVFLASLLWHDR
jgi:hypothetical protein